MIAAVATGAVWHGAPSCKNDPLPSSGCAASRQACTKSLDGGAVLCSVHSSFVNFKVADSACSEGPPDVDGMATLIGYDAPREQCLEGGEWTVKVVAVSKKPSHR